MYADNPRNTHNTTKFAKSRLAAVGIWPTGLTVTRRNVTDVLLSQKILPEQTGESGFRSYFSHGTPAPFRKRKRTRKSSSNRIREKRSNLTKFVKGDAFEQLMGVYLSYSNPEQTVIPQYCLQVDESKGWYGMRADYRIGDTVYEIKWGGADENIKMTEEKHMAALERHSESGLKYRLITLTGESPQHEDYNSLITGEKDRGFPAVAEGFFTQMGSKLLEAAEKRDDVDSARFLRRVRDFGYNVVDEANKRTGDARIGYLDGVFHDVLERIDDRQMLEEYMHSQSPNSYRSLEANYVWEGKVHPGRVIPVALLHEQPERYCLRDDAQKDWISELIDRLSPGPNLDSQGDIRKFLSAEQARKALATQLFEDSQKQKDKTRVEWLITAALKGDVRGVSSQSRVLWERSRTDKELPQSLEPTLDFIFRNPRRLIRTVDAINREINPDWLSPPDLWEEKLEILPTPGERPRRINTRIRKRKLTHPQMPI